MKNSITKDRLKAYTAVAAGALTMISQADAAVQYSGLQNIVLDPINSPLNVDMNGDGVGDFWFGVNTYFNTSYNTWYNLPYVSRTIYNFLYISYHTSQGIGGASWIGYNGLPALLSTNYSINSFPVDPGFSWSNQNGYPLAYYWFHSSYTYPGMSGTVTTITAGNFLGQRGYLGVRFTSAQCNSGNYHYGWIQFEAAADASSGTIIDWAYEDQCNTPILAGDVGTEDGDGVSAEIEDGAPNGGDGNGDGTPDSQQPNVTSLPSATGQGYITVVSSCGQLQNVNAITEGQVSQDPGYNFPFGLVSFEAPCNSATIRVYFHGVNDLSEFIYRKYGPTTPGDPNTTAWYTLPGVVFGTQTIGGNTVAYAEFTLTDGQLGDDTGVDGVIVDQGGPAQEEVTAVVPTMTEWGIFLFMALAGLTGLWFLRNKTEEV